MNLRIWKMLMKDLRNSRSQNYITDKCRLYDQNFFQELVLCRNVEIAKRIIQRSFQIGAGLAFTDDKSARHTVFSRGK